MRAPRFGYLPQDAPRIIAHMQAKGAVFALPAELALECGLRRNEIATLHGNDVDTKPISCLYCVPHTLRTNSSAEMTSPARFKLDNCNADRAVL